ncbi:MAG: hypothetical protein JW797_13000 [Bradymonadales bacterium]|nr:hypothetical protein [Bradymonadales bacterium]
MRRLPAVLFLLLFLPAPARGQVLPLIQESVDGQVNFWWLDPGQPAYTPFDELLFQEATASLVADPGPAQRPAVSRIYRQADLSATSARNLAGLYGARQVLLGSLTWEAAELAVGQVFWVAEATLSCGLYSVDTEITHFEVLRRFVGQGADRPGALSSVRQQAALYLAERLGRSGQGMSAGIENEQVELPTLVLSGLETARLLVAFKGDLRLNGAVVADVREAWATEGQIALEVDLVEGQTMTALEGILQALSLMTDRDYRLTVLDRAEQVIHLDLDPPAVVDEDSHEGAIPLEL